jgi:[acyl-carrier-protein] S-malonyltransferase
MKTAFLFPGQGAQTIGMGKDVTAEYPAAANLYKKANQVLGYDLAGICFEGPAERLDRTDISQPAIFVTSIAMLESLKIGPLGSRISPQVTAGLSLGEYTALYAACLVSFEEALLLVQQRGKAMQAAAEASDGAMVSFIGLDEQKLTHLCAEAAEDELLLPVNFNCPGQIVISGTSAACKRAEKLADKYGAIKAVPLSVAGAFHTEMMAPAAEQLKKALEKTSIQDPSDIKVIANISAEYYSNAGQIKEGLTRQLIQPILWQKCMERLISEGVEKFYEIGPGRVLTGLMKRINRKIKVINISSLQSIQELLVEDQ